MAATQAGRWAGILAVTLAALAQAQTAVPGQQRRSDLDGNGYPDAGRVVTGRYTAVYAYDASGGWVWDLGDGRVEGTASSLEALAQDTLTICDYVVSYRGDFANDPSLDSGWIGNHTRCSGYAENATYEYLIVHRTDPRYRGDPAWAIWGDWEYHQLSESRTGNLVGPDRHAE